MPPHADSSPHHEQMFLLAQGAILRLFFNCPFASQLADKWVRERGASSLSTSPHSAPLLISSPNISSCSLAARPLCYPGPRQRGSRSSSDSTLSSGHRSWPPCGERDGEASPCCTEPAGRGTHGRALGLSPHLAPPESKTVAAAEHKYGLSPRQHPSPIPNTRSGLCFCFSQHPMGWGLSPEPSLGVENRHVEEEGETWWWDAAEQGGGSYGAEEKKHPGIPPTALSSVRIHQVAGTMTSPDPFTASIRTGVGGRGPGKGRGIMMGTLHPPTALGSRRGASVNQSGH